MLYQRQKIKIIKMDKTELIKLSGFYLNFVNDAVINIDELFKQTKKEYYKRRLGIITNLMYLRKQQLKLLILLAEQTYGLSYERRLWQLDRTKSFWEVDCQILSDEGFKNNFRVNRESFEVLCNKLRCLQKEQTQLRETIPLEKRIAIALYSLGSSAEYRSIASLFGIGKSTVCVILIEFCKMAWSILCPEYFNFFPLRKDKIEESVKGFETLGFPQCLGAIDGCHIEVHPNSTDAVDYFNYKGWYSTILFALVDYRYRFLYINVGSPGRCNDSQIFEKSLLKKQLTESPLLNELSKTLSGVEVPVVILGDSAFRLSKTVMKPYPFNVDNDAIKKQYNYSLSKNRRVVENAFGHLKARFRRIGKGVDNKLKNVNTIIKACCVLHNFVNENNDSINRQWLKEVKTTQQPRHETILIENKNGEEIRQAIASCIAAGVDFDADRSFVDAEVDGVEENELLL